MDNPEKYQYKPSEIIAHGGADIRKYLTATGGDKIKYLPKCKIGLMKQVVLNFMS